MRYAALLRGIGPLNPNMRNEKLREAFEKLGFESVQSVISTGNILFETPRRDATALEALIEEGIQKQLGFTSTTMLRSHRQLRRLVDGDPFEGIEDTATSRLNVTFLKKRTRTNLRFPYNAEKKAHTVVAMHGREIFSAVDLSGATTPDLMAWLEKQFGKAITTRTWKTVWKILNRLDSAGG